MSNEPLRFKSHVNLDETKRGRLVTLCNTVLATTIDLHSQVKQAHWNIKGPQFFARHQLFDDLAAHLREWSDDVAERAATLGGYAMGTLRAGAENSRIPEYDLNAVDGRHHIRALVDRYATLTAVVRETVEDTQEIGDVATEDLFTEILRGAELDMWFLESHLAT